MVPRLGVGTVGLCDGDDGEKESKVAKECGIDPLGP